MNIEGFVKAIYRQQLRCEGVVVLQHGKKVAEHRWLPEAPRSCFSVSKSFVSIAIGMAVDREKLSLNDRAAEFFPKLTHQAPKRLERLTLEHLLTMTRGYATFSRPKTVADAFAQTLQFEPGSRFVYDNGSTFLASAMFTRRMGITVRDFLLDALFGPLGMGEPEWADSPDGHTIGATGLMVTTTNLARFGQFLLQRGNWHGKQLVSATWIDRASRPHVGTGKRKRDWNLGYGLCFWPSSHGAYRADGKNGQFVIVLPHQNAVVAINSDDTMHTPILHTVWDHILPLL